MPTSSIGLGPQELSLAFPFHLAFDGESRIVQVGSVLQRLLPDIRPGTNFRDHFRIERPDVEASFDAIREQSHVFFMLESCASKAFVLRGQMLPLEGRRAMVFLGSPWLTEVDELKNLRLSIRDFALHDPISDFLFLLQAQKASLADASLLGDKLAGLNKELEKRVDERTTDLRLANRELEQEISERKQAERALRESEERHRTLVETIPHGIEDIDASGIRIFANSSLHKIYNYGEGELIGKSILDLVTTDSERKELRESLVILVNEQPPPTIYSGKKRTKDGRVIDVQVAWAYKRDKQGRVTGFTSVITEITERKRAEEEIARKNRDLEALLYVTSHDLREPLRAIQTFSRIVHDRYSEQLDEKGKNFLLRVVRATVRLERLLDDILNLSRAKRSEAPTEEVRGNEIVSEALHRLEEKVNATGASVTVANDLPSLKVNKTWITQAVYNLIANALKFSQQVEAPRVDIAPYRSDGETGIVVRDRGPGVPAEHSERIFQLFQRLVDRDVEGTGAGLAIVRQVAERHGGRAWVQPRNGGGSEFIIAFSASQSSERR